MHTFCRPDITISRCPTISNFLFSCFVKDDFFFVITNFLRLGGCGNGMREWEFQIFKPFDSKTQFFLSLIDLFRFDCISWNKKEFFKRLATRVHQETRKILFFNIHEVLKRKKKNVDDDSMRISTNECEEKSSLLKSLHDRIIKSLKINFKEKIWKTRKDHKNFH